MFKGLDDRSEPKARIGQPRGRRFARLALAGGVLALLSGCGGGLSGSTGPSRSAILKAPTGARIEGLRIIDITNVDAARASPAASPSNFAQALGGATPIGTTVGVGDLLEITIWEAAPAALFGTMPSDTRIDSAIQTSRGNTLPQLQVGPSGTISVPFAGDVPAAGRTLRQIEQEIVRRLQGRAHLPQALVRVAKNVTANVTVLGDVKQPTRVPLTPKGERLLDVIAETGGTAQPFEKMTVQITRGQQVLSMSAADIVRDPSQNIVMARDDVVSVSYQPYSFTVLGAAGKNDEVRFEGSGITLSQALGRVGGLRDQRADPKGVYIFRYEPVTPTPLTPAAVSAAPASVPVIYSVDLKNPSSYFAAQKFAIRDHDVIYVSVSPLSEIQNFINVIASSILPVTYARGVLN
ncbi:polysaccharide biosynthesis/export family protein [Sphingomonas ginkgonis]|uniref:polysaccharide biosynthesis/export family protein n=1 Tax=Sphingomonas ginkgonis TaxID=2315330 RepID=UPI001C8BF20C|nr:polysaccharide biosynthesis/export family protein [Sphingomonas ginkgonis]